MAPQRGSGALDSLFRGVRVVTGVVLSGAGLFATHLSVRNLGQHDYVAALLLGSIGLFLVAAGVALFRPEISE